MSSTAPPPTSRARIIVLAVAPLALVGGGLASALVGLGLSFAAGLGVGAVAAGVMAWLDLRSAS